MGGASACDRRVRRRSGEIIVPEGGVVGEIELDFSEQRWAEIRSTIPHEFAPEDGERLRRLITQSCNSFLVCKRMIERGEITARSIKKGGGKQAAPLDQLERSLRSAARILGEIEGILDDRPGMIPRYQAQIGAMLSDIAARKGKLRKLEPVVINPKHELVRSLAQAFAQCGLKVAATNRVYDERSNRPSWFQEFVATVNDCLLGEQGWGASSNDKRALYADVLKALRGLKSGASP
jgi:hypothetical protein